MRIKLTNAIIAKHDRHRKEEYLWDAVISGLGLRKDTKASKAKWVFRFQWQGEQKQMTLGPYPGLTLEAARELASDKVFMLATGAHPMGDNTPRRRTGLTVGELCSRYMREYCELRNRTAINSWSQINKHILPRWRDLPAVELTRQMVRDMHKELAKSPYQANRVLALLQKVWKWGIYNDVLPEATTRPTEGVERYKEESRDRWISEVEMPKLLEVIHAQDAITRAAFLTLLLTGMRKGEVEGMRWEWVDKERQVVSFPAEAVKSGKRQEVPIPAALFEIWPEGTGLVFSTSESRANLYKDWQRIREAAGLEDVRLHDLRRTFASWLIEYEGQSMDLIGGILRHADTRTTKRYAHLGDKRKQSAVDGLAGRLLK